MSVDDEALTWARMRVTGPVPTGPDASDTPDTAVPDGMTRIVDHGTGWLLGTWPDGSTPGLLDEYDLDRIPVERSGETRRALAAALRCCWADLDGAPWPGIPARVDAVTAVYAQLSRGDPDLLTRWAVGALRRLRYSAWIRLDDAEGSVRLGPRVASWPEESLTPLREMLRRLPAPPTSTEFQEPSELLEPST